VSSSDLQSTFALTCRLITVEEEEWKPLQLQLPGDRKSQMRKYIRCGQSYFLELNNEDRVGVVPTENRFGSRDPLIVVRDVSFSCQVAVEWLNKEVLAGVSACCLRRYELVA
jgi:hypothetical protein